MQQWTRGSLALGMVGFVAGMAGTGCFTPPTPDLQVQEATSEQCPWGGKVIVLDGNQNVVCQGAPGADGQSPSLTVTEATREQCANGGYVVTSGDEQRVLCNGAPGHDGADGQDGAPGASAAIRMSPEAPGSECATGGTRVEYGVDADGNGTLDDDEVVTGTTFICNGAQGEAGVPGVGVAIRVTPAGSTACAAGGVIIEYGYDTDGNGQLDGQETAIASSTVCNGNDGQDGQTPSVTVTQATLADCPNGLGGFVLTVDGTSTVYCAPMVVRGEDLPLGAVIYDATSTWNNAQYAWRVVDLNHGGMAGTLTLAATHVVDARSVHDGGWINTWNNSDLRTWLNGTFFASFSPTFAALVRETSVDWTNTSGTQGRTQDKLFIPSRTELGGPALANDGTVFSWFADPATAQARRTGLSNGYAWTRTGEVAGWEGASFDMGYFQVTSTGDFTSGNWSSDALGVLPAVTVHDQALFTKEADGRYRLVISR